MNEAKPFVKWAGGKRQLLCKLTVRLPQFDVYHEPFVGGGALFFELNRLGLITKAYLNDLNPDLMNAYEIVKTNVKELIQELSSPYYKNEYDTYIEIRKNRPEDNVKRAAWLIYLNKTAYNGLYRVNSKGEFNVPFGKYGDPKILDKENLLDVNKVLQKAQLYSLDFEKVLEFAKEKDLIYLDPPYLPISKTSSFTSYTADSFTWEDQVRLFQAFKRMSSKGCYVMLSNSYSPRIEELYKEFRPRIVYAGRAISCKAEGRGKIKELVVRNW